MSAPHEKLIVYQHALVIFDLNEYFCNTYLSYPEKRTIEQMQQASRSGKQNIVEGVCEISTDLKIKLVAVSRASYSELLEDYRDHLRKHNLKLWDKDDPRLSVVRLNHKTYATYLAYKTLPLEMKKMLTKPEPFCNLMITLISQETYMLDKFIIKLESQFIETGGYRENLTKKRLDYKRKNF